MSKIGKKPIKIPEGVKVELEEGKIKVTGPKGFLTQSLFEKIRVEIKGDEIYIQPEVINKSTKEKWGLLRTLISNMIEGVTKGFEKRLEIEGVGYRANIEGDCLVLYLGFTHPIKIKKIPGIEFAVEKNVIKVSGIDKQKVGEIAALIKKQKPVEPYKGKGIKYEGEEIRRKEGKKVVGSK